MTAWPATTEYAGSSAHLTELLAAIAAGQQDALAQLSTISPERRCMVCRCRT